MQSFQHSAQNACHAHELIKNDAFLKEDSKVEMITYFKEHIAHTPLN